MCLGDNPISRAMPYLASGIILSLISLLFYIITLIKKYNPTYIKVTRIILAVISILLLILAYGQLSLYMKC